MNAYLLAKEIKNGKSAEDHIARLLEYIEKKEKVINSFITINQESLREAKEIDKRIKKGENVGVLAGVPIAIKDNICTKGIKTTCASKMLENFIAPYDATVVKRLKDEGALIIGKTNMDEFGMGSSTEFSIIGPTRNPWDNDRVAGGSSGGSAAALVADECSIALGSDTGGSVRCPASFCSCIGFKPTYGLISRYGLISYANSMESIGIFSKTIKDLLITFKVIAGRDEYDNTTHDPKAIRLEERKSFRVAVIRETIEGAEESVKKGIYSSLDKFSSIAKIDEISLPYLKYALAAYYTIAMAEASSNLARYDGMRYGLSMEPEGIEWNRYYMLIRSNFGEEVKRRIILGTYILSAGYYNRYYLKAQKVRNLLRLEVEKIFKNYDIIVSPTMPILPYKIGEKIEDPMMLYLSDIDTILANLTNIPAISLPCAFSNGLPIGLQMMAKYDGEDTLLNAAYAFESLNDLS
ncbi:MAG: Asp-tRNA(Asn)/Glu-tRNA(Gln) amidotransferase subunit GatA [Candidatus Nitrosocaldaceae archaeon]